MGGSAEDRCTVVGVNDDRNLLSHSINLVTRVYF